MADEDFFMPSFEILKIYRDLGGKMVTLGSDAHRAENVDKGLIKGKQILKDLGYKEYYYYEKRTPYSIKI